jgi:hypothetical protein
MPSAITNTSPLIYLHRAGVLDWLNRLFDSVWVPGSVIAEIQQGGRLGYNVPDVETLLWLNVVDPMHLPHKWLSLHLSDRLWIGCVRMACGSPKRSEIGFLTLRRSKESLQPSLRRSRQTSESSD